MPELISVSHPHRSLFATGVGTAVSKEAHAIRDVTRSVQSSAERSQALFGQRAHAIALLRQVFAECSEPDWDGNAARAVSVVATVHAEAFLRALPHDLPGPDVAPEPDGAVSLDWIRGRHRVVSVSIGERSRIAYAWLDGSDHGRGVVAFDGSSVPERIVEVIESIVAV